MTAGKAMEAMMLKDVKYLMENYPNLNTSNIDKALSEINSDDINLADKQGVIMVSTDRESLGVNLYEVEPRYESLKAGKSQYESTNIKKRAEDDKIFKYLGYREGDSLYQVGISIESMLKV